MRRITGRQLVAAPATAVAFGLVVLALHIAEFPLSGLAHQSVSQSNGSLPLWYSAPFGVLGFILAWRKPGNRLGWIILGIAGAMALAEDASFYVVACYLLRHGRLPLGWVAQLAQPGWSVGIVLAGLALWLFPDGRLPSPRLRWLLRVYLASGTVWIAGAFILTVGAIAGHDIHVDSGGNLLLLNHPTGTAAWWGVVQKLVFTLLGATLLVSLFGQINSYRRSSGDRRQQLKWLLGGFVACLVSVAVSIALPSHGFLGAIAHPIALVGVYAIPVGMGVAILRYRLYDIDRLISRTLAYGAVTALLVGVYVGLVLLATRVLPFSSDVAVAVATLVAAALFNPLRRRVQHIVDRRFNRARYDAERTVTAFAARLQDAVDLPALHADLTGTVQRALEPEHLTVYTWKTGS